MNDNNSYSILTDDQFSELVPMDNAVQAIRRAIASHATGDLTAPSRFGVEGEHGSLVFTAGVETDAVGVMGFRVYETIPDSPNGNQLVATYDGDTGALEGVIVGDQVGAVRTGAIGGVALDELARPDATTIGVLGSGRQARTQLRAAATVRDFERVRVFSTTKDNRDQFADELGSELGLDVEAVSSNEAAVRGVDVVITATTSREPVFDPAWLEPGVHINTVGPKFVNANEIDPAVAEDSDVIVTDSLAQVDGYERPFFLSDTSYGDEMVELSALVSGEAPGRERDDDITLFCSVGLAGTEVVVAHEAFRLVSNDGVRGSIMGGE